MMIDHKSAQKYVMYNHVISVMALIDMLPPEDIREVIDSLWKGVGSGGDPEEIGFLNALEKLAMRGNNEVLATQTPHEGNAEGPSPSETG